MIEPRKFNTVVEIMEAVTASDGFGGQVQTVQSIGEVFARVERGGSVRNENGSKLVEFDYTLHIRNREIDPKVNLIKYGGLNYNIVRMELNQLQTQLKLWLTLQD